MDQSSGRPMAARGAAWRRRQRRLRSMPRHERQSVAIALAESQHHSAQPVLLGVVQFLYKVVDVSVVMHVRFFVVKIVEVPLLQFFMRLSSSWTRLLTCPLLCTSCFWLAEHSGGPRRIQHIALGCPALGRCGRRARCCARRGSWSRQCSPWTSHTCKSWTMLLLCPLLLRQVHMVPDVQKTFGGAADAVLRCCGRRCDHAALMAAFMAMGLMGAGFDFAAVFALLRVVWS